MTALGAQCLCKNFGSVQALSDLDLTIESGSFFGLLGPNGAGKSTFMNIVSGFLPADGGSLTVFGDSINPNDLKQKKRIGLSPQHIALYKELSGEKNLAFFGKLYGLRGAKLNKSIDHVLDIAQLRDRRHSLVKEFSGGMKRRLNIAVALLHEPDILLCDEPTVGVDPQSRNAIFDTLTDLKNSGMTVVYSTHYMEEAERLCDTIAIIDRGSILRLGNLDTLLEEVPRTNTISGRLHALSETHREALGQFGEIKSNGSSLHLHTNGEFQLSSFYKWIEERELDAREFQVERPTLENLFLHITGRDLRE